MRIKNKPTSPVGEKDEAGRFIGLSSTDAGFNIRFMAERLHEGSFQAIRKWSMRYFALFMLLVTAVGFIAPEMLLFMGGKSYASAVYVLPPVMAGCIFQFAYTMYVNIETYEKKTGRMALATMAGTLVNE